MCVLAVFAMPYGYYNVLRFVCTASAIAAGVALVRGNQPQVALLAWALAILYNPILRVYLEREVWTVVNLLSAIGLGFLAVRVHLLSSQSSPTTLRGDDAF